MNAPLRPGLGVTIDILTGWGLRDVNPLMQIHWASRVGL